MIYQVSHRSLVRYNPPVIHAHFNLRLRPVLWSSQKLMAQKLTFSPEPASVSESFGPYPVNTSQLAFSEPLREFTVESNFQVKVSATIPQGDGESLGDVRRAALQSRDLTILAPASYLFRSTIVHLEQEIAEWAAPLLRPEEPILSAVRKLTAAIYTQFTYHPGITTSDTPPIEAFKNREGVCQDFAHIMIAALRAHGIPAAYVSGYLRTEPPPGAERLVGADAMHAWASIWCGPQMGWVGADPTNNCLVRNDHIVVAMGRDYADVAPIDGVFVGNTTQRMTVAVDVVPVG